MEEERYTLEEAAKVIAERECETFGHSWDVIQEVGSHTPTAIVCTRCTRTVQVERPVCACRIADSGRGVTPCLHHAQRQAEHAAMYNALQAIRSGVVSDPSDTASGVLADVKFWHK